MPSSFCLGQTQDVHVDDPDIRARQLNPLTCFDQISCTQISRGEPLISVHDIVCSYYTNTHYNSGSTAACACMWKLQCTINCNMTEYYTVVRYHRIQVLIMHMHNCYSAYYRVEIPTLGTNFLPNRGVILLNGSHHVALGMYIVLHAVIERFGNECPPLEEFTVKRSTCNSAACVEKFSTSVDVRTWLNTSVKTRVTFTSSSYM